MFKPVATAGGASHTEKQHTASAALSANCQLLSASRCSIVWLSGVGLPQLKLGHLLHLLNLAPLSAINPSQPPVHPKATQRGALPLPSVPFNPPTDLIVVVPQPQLPPPPLQLLPPPLPRSLGQTPIPATQRPIYWPVTAKWGWCRAFLHQYTFKVLKCKCTHIQGHI